MRWSIYIDIEGSSVLYKESEYRFFCVMDALMDGICRIGKEVSPTKIGTLYVHQTGGDGFILVSDSITVTPEIPISIAVVLMQTVLSKGGIAKAGISQGNFADVKGCFQTLRTFHSKSGVIQLQDGLLRVFPVMGTALINAHRIATRDPRGARLGLDASMATESLPSGVVISHAEKEMLVVDWIHTKTPLMQEIVSRTEMRLPAPHDMEKLLKQYIANAHGVNTEWADNTLKLNTQMAGTSHN